MVVLVAIAEHHGRDPGVGALAFAGRAGRHRVAIEQDRLAEAAPGMVERGLERGMIGAWICATRRSSSVRAIRSRQIGPAPVIRDGIRPMPAAGARRLDQRARRQRRRRDRARIDLALVAVEVDLGPGRAGDEGGGAGAGRAPHQPVDQPVLERLERGARDSRRLEQGGLVIASRHGGPTARPARSAARVECGRRGAIR